MLKLRAGIVAGLVLVGLLTNMPLAQAAVREYSIEKTIPVPPASGFQGSGGGDGWAVALQPESVLNVHHHQNTLTVACRRQVDASQCWTAATKTVRDASGGNFGVWHPGLALEQATGRMYVFAVRATDNVGGVVCIDTGIADAEPNPFCGFMALTGAGEANYNLITNGAVIGRKFYAFNNGAQVGGARNKVLCFDLDSEAACANQPYDVGVVAGSSSQTPTISAVGGRMLIPMVTGQMHCFNPTSGGSCPGIWPVTILTSSGAPYPLLDGGGQAVGVCVPQGSNPCFDLGGAPAATPVGLAGAVGSTSYWNGPALTIGPRIYVPNGNTNSIRCFDFASSASCPNFPRQLSNQSLTYTVNADPQRPTCIWTNADNGSAQIQNFDAYSGSPCGEGPIRVLASSIVVNSPQCVPSTYRSLAVLSPARDQYGSGSIAFEDGSGRPIAGIAPVVLDGSGVGDLQGLNLNTASGLPQFLITLEDPLGAPASVTIRLKWSGEDSVGCEPLGGGGSRNYVALGDSYSSGEGAYAYLQGTDKRGNCHRSSSAYPQLLAADVAAPDDFRFVACSGAIIRDLFLEQRIEDTSSGRPAPQLDSLDQATALVTLSIGGNDIGFADVLASCVRGRNLNGGFNCRKEDRQVRQSIARLSTGWTDPDCIMTPSGLVCYEIPPLRELYAIIARRAPAARIVVLGYPRLWAAPIAGDQCEVGAAAGGVPRVGANYHVHKNDAAWMNDMAVLLNQTIRGQVNAARAAGVNVHFVPMDDAFHHRRLCEPGGADPWLRAADIDTSRRAPRQESFHPKPEGHAAIYGVVKPVALG